ncbi:MAG: glycosyltransferase family 4 protein [Actinomycetota bacterium]
MSDEPVRVVAVCAVNGFGGPVRSLATVVAELGERVRLIVATQPTVVASNRPGDGDRSPLQELADDQIELPLPRGAGLPRAQWALLRAAGRVRRADVVHANGLTEAVAVLPVALATRARVVVWVHNYATPRPFALAATVLGPLLRRWRWAAVSRTARDLLPAGWTIETIPNPVESGGDRDRPMRPRPLTVVYLAGTDHPVKGFDLLPDIVRATPPDAARFVVHAAASQRSDHPASRAAWAELTGPLADRVEIGPFVADVAPILDAADLVLVPSRRESFNRVLAEALAHGVPVVASDIAPHREHFADGAVGRTFRADDAVDAARAIVELADDPDERERCAQRGWARVEGFAPPLVAEQLLAAWSAS